MLQARVHACCVPAVRVDPCAHVQALPWWNTAWGSIDLLDTREDVEGTGEEEQQAPTQEPNTACSPAHPPACNPATMQPRNLAHPGTDGRAQ